PAINKHIRWLWKRFDVVLLECDSACPLGTSVINQCSIYIKEYHCFYRTTAQLSRGEAVQNL
ncbi:MAG: hypothetical protein NTZ28_03955, partial [Nitrospirae bacterium]|nr:hypothetical protein [Nitrospirota bacterium]